MARVWTSGVLESLGVSGPLSLGSRWLSALSSGFEPAADMMITPRLRLLRPVQDVRGGRLWVAEHQGIGTHVEVTFASAPTDSGAAAEAESFLIQASVTAHINEPHVVSIFEHGDVKGVPFVVTELLEGRNLRQRLMHGPASIGEAESVVRQACDALAKAHAMGIAHGHLRLDCLFSTDVGGQPFLKIAGFGAPPPEGPTAYSSPEELLLGTAPDAASDLWALAVSMYELLTTTLPFEAATAAGVTVAICNGQFALPTHYRADLPRSVDSWFAQALATDKNQRFASATEFAHSFVQALSGEVVTPQAPAVVTSASYASADYSGAGFAGPSFTGPSFTGTAPHVPLELAPLLEPQADEPPALEAPASSRSEVAAEGHEHDDAEVPSDDSLEMDDDGEEEEKTVKWDMPDNWAANLAASGAVVGAQTLRGLAAPGVSAARPGAQVPTVVTRAVVPPAEHRPSVASAMPARLPSLPPAMSPSAPPPLPSRVSALASTLPPPALEPSTYLESPYIASVASALAVPQAGLAEPGRVLPGRLLSGRLLSRLGLPGHVAHSGKGLLSFKAEKTWLAAAAFAAGVAVTWFVYDPTPSDTEATLDANGAETDLAGIRTVSVDDLPTVAGDDDEKLAIIRTSQLPKAAEENEEAAAAPVVARVVPVSTPVRSSAPVQKVQALSPPPRAHASSSGAAVAKAAPAPKAEAPKADSRSNCSPPYFFDGQGIRRLKPECLNGSGVVAGPYGAVMNTNVAAKSAAPAPGKAAPAAKQARANASCTPPYYFDGNIRRIKLECL